jgi:hypothetical protein
MALLADPRPSVDEELLDPLCRALRTYLERQVDLLNEQVRHYPGPIARCDDQLTGLLEQRSAALAQLARLEALGERDPTRADGLALAGQVLDVLSAAGGR